MIIPQDERKINAKQQIHERLSTLNFKVLVPSNKYPSDRELIIHVKFQISGQLCVTTTLYRRFGV